MDLIHLAFFQVIRFSFNLEDPGKPGLNLKLITTEKDFIKIKEIVPNISNQIIPLKIKLKINNKDQLIEKIKSAIYENN